MLKLLLALSALWLPAASAAELTGEKPVTIVLVHGAFVDGSGWRKVYDILAKDGFEKIVVQNATATLEDDVATADRAIARARHPVVLVGHSYGGAVITEAGNEAKVKSLVYLAAFAPDEGESAYTWIEKPAPGFAPVPILPPQDGYLTLDIAKFPASFAADVDLEMTRFMAASQTPWGLAAVKTPIGKAAWRAKPTYFLITTEDHMIPTSQQRDMAARAHAETLEVESSHAVMLSHPDKVAAFIERAADKAF